MYLYVDKNTQQIKMTSDEKIEIDKNLFNEIKHNENFEKFKNGGYGNVGYTMYYKDGQIEKTRITLDKEDLKQQVESATTVKQLKEIITKLL